jgi:hypothetical protein
MPVLYTTIERYDAANDDHLEFDVAVEFDARMTSRGSRQTWMQPAEGPEFDIEFAEARLLQPVPPGGLTTVELVSLRRWFDANQDAAIEAANDDDRGY